MPNFHSPPARRGVYAFVEQTVSHFLLSQEKFDPRRVEWVRDDAGHRILADSDAAKELIWSPERRGCLVHTAKDGQCYLARPKRPRYFDYDGEIWHHLPVPRSEVLKEKGSWVKTTAQAHKKAFTKAFHKRTYALERGQPALLLDAFEVFIEKV